MGPPLSPSMLLVLFLSHCFAATDLATITDSIIEDSSVLMSLRFYDPLCSTIAVSSLDPYRYRPVSRLPAALATTACVRVGSADFELRGILSLEDSGTEGIFQLESIAIPFKLEGPGVTPYAAPKPVPRSRQVDIVRYSSFMVHLECHSTKAVDEPRFPAVQTMPSPESPFVFLHIDKTAGTKLRKLLRKSSELRQLGFFIPCEEGLPCPLFSIEGGFLPAPLESISVAAGHFAWGAWRSLRAFKPSANEFDAPPPCLIMFRHPVARVTSYYYRRIFSDRDDIYSKELGELTYSELEFLLYHIRHPTSFNNTLLISDEGMSNAVCRFLLDRRRTTGLPVSARSVIIDSSPELAEEDKELASARAVQCVVGLQEDMRSTIRVIRHWFPWISMSDEEHNMKENDSNSQSTPNLSASAVKLIEMANQCDMYVYNRVVNRFQAQLKHIDKS